MAAVLVPGCASEPSTGTVTAKSYQPGMWIEKPYSHKCGQQTCTSTRPTFIPPSYFLTIRPSKSLKRVQFQVTEYVYYDCQPGDRWTEDPVNHESGTCRPPEGG